MTQAEQLKRDICEIGRRIYAKGFAAANDGNITVRVSDNEVLCTPTLHCKGFLEPDDIALIDLDGHQLEGNQPRSSEALMHLAVYKARPDVTSVVHCHPPHATAFAVAREAIPQCILPEVEMFLGEVPISRYATPGTPEFAATIEPFLTHCRVIVLANHGTVSFGDDVERAFWWTELLDAYCRILILAGHLGPPQLLGRAQVEDLLRIKQSWGCDDPRHLPRFQTVGFGDHAVSKQSWPESEVSQHAFAPWRNEGGGAHEFSPREQKLIDEITRRVLAGLQRAE